MLLPTDTKAATLSDPRRRSQLVTGNASQPTSLHSAFCFTAALVSCCLTLPWPPAHHALSSLAVTPVIDPIVSITFYIFHCGRANVLRSSVLLRLEACEPAGAPQHLESMQCLFTKPSSIGQMKKYTLCDPVYLMRHSV